MRKRTTISFRWLSLASHLLVMALPLALIVASGAVTRDLQATTERALVTESSILADQARIALRAQRATAPSAQIETINTSLSESFIALKSVHTGSRLLDKNGFVVATSGPGIGVDLSNQPEVQNALLGEQSTQIRKRQHTESTAHQESYRPRVFTATPVILDGVVEGVVVVASTPRSLIHFTLTAHRRLTATLLLSLLATILFAWVLTKRTTQPLIALTANTRNLYLGAKLTLVEGSSISEVDQLAQAYNHKQAQLSARLAYISELSANIAHEFKTPITTMRASIELVRDDTQMPADTREKFLSTSILELNRLTRLIDGLLQLARAEEELASTSVSLDDIATAVALRIPNTVVEGRAGTVPANHETIETALTNLVNNGWEHGNASLVTIRCWRKADSTAGFDVIDNGLGINPAITAQLFSRFFTTNRENGGTGLGLAIARAAIRAHGGDLTLVQSSEQTVFRISVPTSAVSHHQHP
jgi:signal transduction histidine kinase